MEALLVVFASKNGSTAEVAESIAQRLRARGAQAEAVPARHPPDLARWGGVVVGAPIYSGRWLSGGHRILKKLAKLPADRRPPIAVFALGPRRDEGPEDWVRPRRQFEQALGKHPSISPVSTALFGGTDPPKKKIRRDVRNWEVIQAWADELAHRFGAPSGASGEN